MNPYQSHSMWTMAIIEHTFRRIDFEKATDELEDLIKFATDYRSTLENTIERLNVEEYVADLGTELNSYDEDYDANIDELSHFVYYESRKSSLEYVYQLPRSRRKASRNAMSPENSIRRESPKRIISIDHSAKNRRVKAKKMDVGCEICGVMGSRSYFRRRDGLRVGPLCAEAYWDAQ